MSSVQNNQREIELKFRRLVNQRLPESNFSKALVINSGDGLVCEYLRFIGIEDVTGIESNESAREAAQAKLSNVDFVAHLSQLKEKNFDLVFVLDKVDFLKDETENEIFESITKNARYIVADLFTYDSMSESEFIAFRLSATEKMYMPTTLKMVNQFPEHLARKVDESPTRFNNVIRIIWHFRKRLPYAVVLEQRPWSGKTTLAKNLFSDLTHIELDESIKKIKSNQIDVSKAVKKFFQSPEYFSMWGKKLYQALADNDCYIDFVKDTLASYDKISKKGVIVDGFVPPEHVGKLNEFLSKAGYYVVEIGLTNTLKPDADYSIKQVQNFFDSIYSIQ